MRYEDAVAYLSTLQKRGWRLGLDRMEALALRAGVSDNLGRGHTQYLHVAGTNGKGSVTAYLQSILVEAGLRTGAFYSPFVVDLRERVQFGRDLISEADFARLMKSLIPIAESLDHTDYGSVTEFEMKTALALRYWKERECDWVALEVGLGGRLDATNIVNPAASGIVSIGYDHMAILGNTLFEIATEKAGIVKPGRPVVTGDLPNEAVQAVAARVAETDSPWWRFGHELVLGGDGIYSVATPVGTIDNLMPGLVGAPQPHNMAVAVGMILASGAVDDPEAIRRGVATASLPGRFQRLDYGGKRFILDGAHNGESARALRASLDKWCPGQQFTLITGMVDGHEPSSVMAPLRDVVAQSYVVPIDFYRAVPPAMLAPHVPNATACESTEEGIEAAWGHEEPVLVTGSFYLVGDVLRTLERLRSVD